jgi:hypothetical protein
MESSRNSAKMPPDHPHILKTRAGSFEFGSFHKIFIFILFRIILKVTVIQTLNEFHEKSTFLK